MTAGGLHHTQQETTPEQSPRENTAWQAALDMFRMPSGYEVSYKSLRFLRPELEAAYQTETLSKEIPLARIAILIGCVMLGTFILLDWFIARDSLFHFLAIRLLFGCPLLLALIPLSLLPVSQENRRSLLSLSLIVPNISILWMIAIAPERVAELYYVGLILTMCFLVCLWRMGYVAPSLSSFATVAAYNVIMAYKDVPAESLVAANFFLNGAALTFIYLSYSREVVQRREFARTDILRRERIELERLGEEAEAANKAKSAFIATMNHELRTPLNAIIGFSDILHNGSIPLKEERKREYAKDIHDSGQHLLELINDILDLSRGEAGMIQRDDEVFSPAEEAERVVRMLRERAARGDIELSIGDFPRDLHLEADARLFRQVLTNFVTNAVKFTPAGGTVTVTARGTLDGFRVEVIDTGIGIAEHELEKMFEPFCQSDNSDTRRYEGTGLGLAIVRQIAEVHGGRAWLESEIGHGTRAIIEFPTNLIREGIAA